MAALREFALKGGIVTTGDDAGYLYGSLYGFGISRELELQHEAGFHPLEVLRTRDGQRRARPRTGGSPRPRATGLYRGPPGHQRESAGQPARDEPLRHRPDVLRRPDCRQLLGRRRARTIRRSRPCMAAALSGPSRTASLITSPRSCRRLRTWWQKRAPHAVLTSLDAATRRSLVAQPQGSSFQRAVREASLSQRDAWAAVDPLVIEIIGCVCAAAAHSTPRREPADGFRGEPVQVTRSRGCPACVLKKVGHVPSPFSSRRWAISNGRRTCGLVGASDSNRARLGLTSMKASHV